MEQFLGIDLGTQGVKVIGWDEEGNFLGSTSREYPILTPQIGFAEQNPEIWWEKTKEAIKELVELGFLKLMLKPLVFLARWNSNNR